MRLLNLKTREKPHSTHTMFILLFIEVKAVHGLLSTARTNTVLLKVPRIIFETSTGHRRHKWRIRSVDHSSCYAMTLSALMYLLCALKYTKVYKKIFVQKSLQ